MKNLLKLIVVSSAVELSANLFAAVGPNYHRPAAPTPASYADSAPGVWKAAVPADAIARGNWWIVFHDPALEILERQAAENNQDLKAAVARVTQARAIARIAEANFFPRLALDPAYAYARNSPDVLNPRQNNVGNDVSVPLDLSYELDLWGRVRRVFEASKADAQASQADFESALLVLKADVAQNYFALRTFDTERAVLRNTAGLRQEALKLINDRYHAGAASDLEVAQAETELSATEAQLLAVDRSRAETEHALAVLEGKPASEFAVKELPLTAAISPPPIPAGLPGELLERRPDIAEAERTLAAANARIGVAKGAFFPVVRLTGAAGFESVDVETVFNWESRVWSLGPSITMPLFEGGRLRANLKRSQAAYEENVANYRQRVLVAFKEVQNALTDTQLLSRQAEAQERSEASARRSADTSNSRYLAGLVSYLEVVDSERTALEAERESARLTGQRLVTCVQLIKALGGGWQDSSVAGFAVAH